MSPLVHMANVISLASYLVRDVLWLRTLSICASALTITYLVTADTVQWSAIAWSSVFSSINVVQIIRLLRERRPVHFDADQHHLYDLVFRSLKPRDFLRLWNKSRWHEAAPQEQLITTGQAPPGVMVVCAGEVSVVAAGKTVATLKPGHFVGEMSFVTGGLPKADVVATAPARLRLWKHDELRGLLDAAPELRATVQVVLGTDLIRKLQG